MCIIFRPGMLPELWKGMLSEIPEKDGPQKLFPIRFQDISVSNEINYLFIHVHVTHLVMTF